MFFEYLNDKRYEKAADCVFFKFDEDRRDLFIETCAAANLVFGEIEVMEEFPENYPPADLVYQSLSIEYADDLPGEPVFQPMVIDFYIGYPGDVQDKIILSWDDVPRTLRENNEDHSINNKTFWDIIDTSTAPA